MYHDHAYFALSARRDADHTHLLGRPAVRCAANRHAHGAVPDYIIDYRSKRTCSIGYLSRFQDFGQDFKISVKISIETYEISRVSDPSLKPSQDQARTKPWPTRPPTSDNSPITKQIRTNETQNVSLTLATVEDCRRKQGDGTVGTRAVVS